MREPHLSGAIFALAVGLVVFVQIISLPPKPTAESLLNRQRDEQIIEYLLIKSDFVSQDMMEQFLEDLEKRAEENIGLSDLASLFLGLEGQPDRAKTYLEKIENLQRKLLLSFCLGFGGELPSEWQSVYPDGWVKAKLTSLIYKTQQDQTRYAESLVSIREYENVTRRFAQIHAILQVFGFMGFMFLISMVFSRRYHQLVGKPFFLLSPILISPERLLRFAGLLLIGFVFTGSLASWIFGARPSIWPMIVGYFLFILVAIYLAKTTYFESGQRKLLQLLQLNDLRMKFSKLWQIFKAVAILVALSLASIAFSYLLSWTMDRYHQNSIYQNLLEDPFSASVLLILACIVAPIFEEIIFRGMIQRGLLCFGKPLLAMLVSALIFALIHPLPQWPMTFAIGLGLGLVYQRTSDLLICILAHATWNGMVLLLLSYGVYL